MDTVYYTLNTRRVKVSGGPDLVRLIPAAPAAARPHGGEILDLELCRKRLETKNAWKELARTAREAAEEWDGEETLPAAPVSRQERAGAWLELGATAAVLLTAISAAAAFLSVL